MIRRLVDFSLDNRFLVLAAAFLLLCWGAISFHQLPVEAYPDVANNYVEIITQWPGISAEQIEQQVTLPPGVVAQMGTNWSPVGQIYFFTLKSTNPNYDVMELKSIEDWIVEKNFKAVPDVVDVASLGGPTREYQVRI